MAAGYRQVLIAYTGGDDKPLMLHVKIIWRKGADDNGTVHGRAFDTMDKMLITELDKAMNG